jgi:pyridoxal phosphate enzyme (YggS family)
VTRITEQIDALKVRIRAAAELAGRNADSIRILAVSKKHPADAVLRAQQAGLTNFGENYVQEGLEKMAGVPKPACWHFIGRIQSNKTRPIAENFDWAQTVCDRHISQRLSDRRQSDADPLQVCIQIRPTGANKRDGAPATAVPDLADFIRSLPGLQLRGLMIIPLPNLSEVELRSEYARASSLMEKLVDMGHDLDTLSMGMSNDLEAAIMEGSNMVRIGTAVFGSREQEMPE